MKESAQISQEEGSTLTQIEKVKRGKVEMEVVNPHAAGIDVGSRFPSTCKCSAEGDTCTYQ